MAAFDTTRTAYGSVVAVSRVSSFFISMISAVAAWSDARTTRIALSNLTDRELEDIGLVRGDIAEVSSPTLFR